VAQKAPQRGVDALDHLLKASVEGTEPIMSGAILGSVVGAGASVIVVIYLAVAVLMIVATVKILSKAGYSGWWVLIGLVPVANVVMYVVFAFSDWPALRGRATPVEPSWPRPPQ